METRIASPLAERIYLSDKLCENLITHVHPDQWASWMLSLIKSLDAQANESDAKVFLRGVVDEIQFRLKHRRWKTEN